ncbi:cytochrome c oxidase subunit 6b, partial [Phenoliferia sp. Uapishka_3]
MSDDESKGVGVFKAKPDYFRCVDAKGEDFAPCKNFFKSYHSLCPNEWTTRWDEQREAGNFPAKLTAK